MIVIASDNRGKIEEVREQLKGANLVFVPQSKFNVPAAQETGLSFIENALIKARNACEYSSLPALGDDSGIEVDALGGAPGIYTSRYAGPSATDVENINKLLAALRGVPKEKRSARFQCVIALMRHAKDPSPIICQGTWEGAVLFEPRGQMGHGYDPIFYVPTHDCSAAELSLQEKITMSHRAKAIAKLLNMLS